MSLLFDQNLSRKLLALLATEFPGSEQVVLAGLAAVITFGFFYSGVAEDH